MPRCKRKSETATAWRLWLSTRRYPEWACCHCEGETVPTREAAMALVDWDWPDHLWPVRYVALPADQVPGPDTEPSAEMSNP